MPYRVWELGDEARAAYKAAQAAGKEAAERAARKAAKEAAELAAEKATKRVGKKGSRLIPGIGTFVAIGFFAEDVQARGIVCGTLNSGLDATPWLGNFKAATEIASGEDWIPDKATQAAQAEFWRRYNEQVDFYRTIEEEYRRDHDPWGWGR